MLERLTIQNFALLKHVDLSFDKRFNVLSGETGAGKSIIIDAVKLILGERANTADIRSEQDEAVVEAVFSVCEGHPVLKKIEELGLEAADTVLVLTRQVRNNGKNTCRINRQIVTLGQFKDICSDLISIYGQHDYDELGDAEIRLALLDALGDTEFHKLKSEVSLAYQRARKSGNLVKRKLKEMKKANEELHLYQARVDELKPLQLKKGEETQLNEAFKQAAHAQDLYEGSYKAASILYDAQSSAHEMVTGALEALRQVERYDKDLHPYIKDLESALIIIDDTARELDHYKDSVDINPEKLNQMNQRLTALSAATRKYQMDSDALVDALKEWETKIDQFQNLDDEIARFKKQYQQDKQTYDQLAQALHEKRIAIADEFSAKLIQELKLMAMEQVRFEVQFESFAGDATGQDIVTFMIAPNPGMPIRPLYETASGGEMSRVMLAIKSIISSVGDVETLIFDEIDTGIGGMVLSTVADKLEDLGQREQVICVTHAASIAARADRNFFIEKRADAGSTVTYVKQLETEEEVISEIARMNGSQNEWQMEFARRQRAAKQH